MLAELPVELGAERAIMILIEKKLDRFVVLDDRALDIAGGRELAPAQLHAVPR